MLSLAKHDPSSVSRSPLPCMNGANGSFRTDFTKKKKRERRALKTELAFNQHCFSILVLLFYRNSFFHPVLNRPSHLNTSSRSKSCGAL